MRFGSPGDGRPRGFEPAYVKLYESGELARRAERARELLRDCIACPRDCHVNRLENHFAVCKTGRYAVVGSCFAHFGEEDCLRGWQGSGTIFFGYCNLRCVFCQNYDLSWEGRGREVGPERLAEMMLELQAEGSHNINFVTPEHVVPQIMEALPLAIARGLRLPLVYNTSAYDSLESLALMDGVVDIYMPDFKFWEPGMARLYSRAPNYPEAARRAIKEMHRQVGDLELDDRGLAKRGVLLRHLVMPGGVAGTREILHWVRQELGPNTYLNLMPQYYPAGKVGRNQFSEINRRITPAEYEEALQMACEEGLLRLDSRPRRGWRQSLPLSPQ